MPQTRIIKRYANRKLYERLVYPGLMRGLLEARCTALAPRAMIATATAIAEHDTQGRPSPMDGAVHAAVTRPVLASLRHARQPTRST